MAQKNKYSNRDIAEKMRRVAIKEQSTLTEQAQAALAPIPTNYISPEVIESLTSVRKDKPIFDKIISKALMEMILNGDNKEKLAAIDRYQKLVQSNQLLIKSGSNTAAFEGNSEGPTTLNIDLSNHIRSDEVTEKFNVKSRDLVKEANEKNYGLIEDATYEIMED